MTEPDDALRGALRDLIPDYAGPADPLPRVVASVRRRRSRQRVLLAVGGTGLAVVLALAVPAMLVPHGNGTAGLQAGHPGQPTEPAPSPSGGGGPPAAAPEVYPVAAGYVSTTRWEIGSTSLSSAARLCLLSNDTIFTWDTVCFDGWTAGAPVTWAVQPVTGGGVSVTRIGGVAPGPSVRVRLTDEQVLTVPARRTATDGEARFFGLVVPGTVAVRTITALDASGADLGPPVADPGTPCRPGPNVLCN